MRPVVSVEEMRKIDESSPVPTEVLIERAGGAVARAALALLGGSYARRAVVVAGKGHNGDDGRVAARKLAARGVRVEVVDAKGAPRSLPACDLVIDAAYGTGFKGTYTPPAVPDGAQVLAVDIPSGLSGDTGEVAGDGVRATHTVTFAALKPGLLFGEGPERCGRIEVADIGLDARGASTRLVEDPDVRSSLPRRRRQSHKWETAVYIAAGSPGMMGSAELASMSAMRAGAGIVRLGVPGASASDLPAGEVVAASLPNAGWENQVLEQVCRCKALVIGPGLGSGEAVRPAVTRLLAEAPVPVVLDADGLNAVGPASGLARTLKTRTQPVVLTPHDGEFARLFGSKPGPDRIDAATALARAAGAVVLLKGSTTVVASPGGGERGDEAVLLASAGSPRLATAGTGDVLSGVIAAFLARGLDAQLAAALGAHVHGRAAGLGPSEGLVAGDLPELVSRWLSIPADARVRGGGVVAGD